MCGGICCRCCSSCAVQPIPPSIDLSDQSEQLRISGPDVIRVSKFHPAAKRGHFISYFTEDAKTLYESFRKGAKQSNNGRCLGWRDGPGKGYQWLSYNEALLRAKNFGSGLVSLGLAPGQETIIGLYSTNCPEWILCEQAAYCYSMVIVPLYDTLGPDACSFIISQAEITTIVCENDNKVNMLLERAPRHLRKIVVIKEASPATRQRAKNRGIELHRFDDVERMGAGRPLPDLVPRPGDLCTICYTSGTTGSPKGVMLSHENVVAAISACLIQLGEQRPGPGDVMISFLPLAHMLERCCENAMYMVGGAVGFYSGDIRRLTDDMKVLKPTVAPSVPRVLNRLYDKTMAEISTSFLKRILFNMALSAKFNEVKKGIFRRNSFWDKTVFRKIQESMGGHVRLMIVGSAPLAGPVLTFARAALGCIILEGYGQTECCAPITLSVVGESASDQVGPPLPCCCVKLSDVPEMEYYSSMNQGEVCVKGTNVFLGYYKEYDTTLQTVDEMGWHHTGDVGQWMPNGTLKIIDRRKHIFKLSQGEYVVPEKIEAIYSKSQYVHQVFVYGESLKSCIVAIVVPKVEVVKSWAFENNIEGTFSVLCAHPEVKKLIIDDMVTWGKDAGLKSFELVKDIYLHPDPFSMQNGLLTPTFKPKRPHLKAYFKPQLDDMYAKLS